MNIGKRIKKLRCEFGFTQEELASVANTTKQTIHKYETGIVSNIPASRIKAIADKLNTTPAYLMGWEEEIEPNAEQKATAPELRAEIKELVNAASDLPTEKIKTLTQVAESMKNT